MTLQNIKDDLGWSLHSKGSCIYNVYIDAQFQGQIRKVNTNFTVVDLLDGNNYQRFKQLNPQIQPNTYVKLTLNKILTETC